MDQLSSIDRLGPPVEGATAFRCHCNATWVSYLRGNVRVFVYVAGEPGYADTVSTRIAVDLDAILVPR